MLHKRDYFSLTEEEKIIKKKIDSKKIMTAKEVASIPKFYFFNSSYFPNHMLDILDLKSKKNSTSLKAFTKLVQQKTIGERDIIKFIKQNRAYFIIGSVLKEYNFGNHGAYLFPEFPLSTNHVADYLIVGKNSGGHEFIFIELESIYGSITKGNGSIGESIRKGINQIEDWKFWLEKNFGNLSTQFDKYRNKNKLLPGEYLDFDQSRMHYVVIAGRRENYTDYTYRKRRTLFKESNIKLLHYDNLIDYANVVILSGHL